MKRSKSSRTRISSLPPADILRATLRPHRRRTPTTIVARTREPHMPAGRFRAHDRTQLCHHLLHCCPAVVALLMPNSVQTFFWTSMMASACSRRWRDCFSSLRSRVISASLASSSLPARVEP